MPPALLLLLTLASARLPAHDLGEMKARGTLRVLTTDEDYPDWFALKGGTDPGFERELLEGFTGLHRLRLEVVIVPSFEAVIPALLAGQGDLIQGIIDTPARRKQIAFTDEVLPSRYVAVSLRAQLLEKALDGLRPPARQVLRPRHHGHPRPRGPLNELPFRCAARGCGGTRTAAIALSLPPGGRP